MISLDGYSKTQVLPKDKIPDSPKYLCQESSGHLSSSLSFQDQFSDSYLMRRFLYTFCSLGYFCPYNLLALTHCEEKQLYEKTGIIKSIGGTISLQSNTSILTGTYLYFTGSLYFKQVLKAGFTFGGSVKFRKLKSEGSPLILES